MSSIYRILILITVVSRILRSSTNQSIQHGHNLVSGRLSVHWSTTFQMVSPDTMYMFILIPVATEIPARREACEAVEACIDTLPTLVAPDISGEVGPFHIYSVLQRVTLYVRTKNR
jgi:hypothetical protein